MAGLIRITYILKSGDSTMKVSEMLPLDTTDAAIADVKARHPTDLMRITSVAQLK